MELLSYELGYSSTKYRAEISVLTFFRMILSFVRKRKGSFLKTYKLSESQKLSLIHGAYTDKKAVQAAYHLIEKAGGTIDYILLLKILYVADRFSFERRHFPITFDRLCNMQMGPLGSGIYDRIKPFVGMLPGPPEEHWDQNLTNKGRYKLTIKRNPGSDELSENDLALLDEAYVFCKKYKTIKALDKYYLHKLPEYRDPGNSSTPITITSLLKAIGLDSEEISECLDELLVDASLQETSLI